MDAENVTPNELPDEPSREPENTRGEEIVSEKPDDVAKVEEEKPATPANEPEIISQTEQEEASALPVEETGLSTVTEEAENATVSQQAENLLDEQVEAAEITEVVQTTADDESETAEIEPDAASLPAEQPDIPATGNIPARQKSKYTPWMQIVAAIVLICVIGGIVLAVRQSTNGHGQTVLGTATPLPPLTVKNWCTVDVAAGAAQNTQVNLRKIVALSANNAWVLGTLDTLNANGSISQSSPLLEYWNGYAWRMIQTADTSALVKQLQGQLQQYHFLGATSSGQMSSGIELNDLAVLSEHNIWVVGQVSVSETVQIQATYPGFSGPIQQTLAQPLIEHWDGNTWQVVASPTDSPFGGFLDSTNQLTSISAIAANNIWAMGTQMSQFSGPGLVMPGNSGVTSTAVIGGAGLLIEHWDGTSWTEQQLPKSQQQQNLSSGNIQALAANDVWSFEELWSFENFGPVIIGKQIIGSGTPVAGTVTGIAKFKKSEGSPSFAPPSVSSQMLHWDGKNWNALQLPADPTKSFAWNGMTAIADNNIWAFGSELLNANGTPVARSSEFSSGATQDKFVAAIYHWDGSAWTQVANAPGTDASNLTSMSVIAPDNLWLLGSTAKGQPLLEHWNGKTWKAVAPKAPAYGSATQVTVAGQRAWALVDRYPNPADLATPSPTVFQSMPTTGNFSDTIGTVLETSC